MEILLPSCSLSIKQLHYSCRKSPKIASFSCRAVSDSTNYYNLLSLSSSNAGIDEIKKAYRTLALKYHPDVSTDPSTKEEYAKMFILLNAAYKTLLDPLLREEYNFGMGLYKSQNTYMVDGCRGEVQRGRWEDQVVELGKKSIERATQNDGSWGARVRAKNTCNNIAAVQW